MLGGKDMPAIEEPRFAARSAARYPATESYRPLEQQPLAQRPQQPKKAGWSLFGRKKNAVPDMRAEPLAAERPRATATPMQRPVVQEPVAPPPGEDLFPDHGADEQFEIPAFLAPAVELGQRVLAPDFLPPHGEAIGGGRCL